MTRRRGCSPAFSRMVRAARGDINIDRLGLFFRPGRNRSNGGPAPGLAIPVAERTLHVALLLAVPDRVALVALLLAAGQRQLDLGARAREVDPRRDEREPALLRLPDQPLDL